MKAVLISIQPHWCELIASGEKTLEVRKTRPKLATPFKVYIYCTNTRPYLVWDDVFRGDWETEFTHISGYSREQAKKIWDVFNGHIIGEFICDRTECFTTDYRMDKKQTERISKESCVEMIELMEYEINSPFLYAWHISAVEIYDTPKELNKFHKPCGTQNCDICQFWENTGEYAGCLTSEERRLRRPPQIWCYVEED